MSAADPFLPQLPPGIAPAETPVQRLIDEVVGWTIPYVKKDDPGEWERRRRRLLAATENRS